MTDLGLHGGKEQDAGLGLAIPSRPYRVNGQAQRWKVTTECS